MPKEPMLKRLLIEEADKVAPLHPDYPDLREYYEDQSNDAPTDAWPTTDTSYILKVGVLAQTDSNKWCDWVRLFIGHERSPGTCEYIGSLHWRSGENDDVGRSLERYIKCARMLHPVFETH